MNENKKIRKARKTKKTKSKRILKKTRKTKKTKSKLTKYRKIKKNNKLKKKLGGVLSIREDKYECVSDITEVKGWKWQFNSCWLDSFLFLFFVNKSLCNHFLPLINIMQDKSIEELKEKFKQNDENNKIIKNHQHPQVTNEKFKEYQDFSIKELKNISINIKDYLKYLKPGTTKYPKDIAKMKNLIKYKNNICSAIKSLCDKTHKDDNFKIFMGDSDLAAICAFSNGVENIIHPIDKKKNEDCQTGCPTVLFHYFFLIQKLNEKDVMIESSQYFSNRIEIDADKKTTILVDKLPVNINFIYIKKSLPEKNCRGKRLENFYDKHNSIKNNNVEFKLIGIIHGKGIHYTVFIKNDISNDNSWYRYDDNPYDSHGPKPIIEDVQKEYINKNLGKSDVFLLYEKK